MCKNNNLLILKIKTQIQSQIAGKPDNDQEEDYDDDLDESVGDKKNEQVNQMGKLEPKSNNMNEVFGGNPAHTQEYLSSSQKIKFYTCPDDVLAYRNGYPYANFSFTPQSQTQLNMNDNYSTQQMFPIFPTIPQHYKVNQKPLKQELTLDENLFTMDRTNSKDREE
jgi:hypothetical protein